MAMPPERDAGHVYHLFPVRSPQRDQLQGSLRDAGIGTLVHYPKPLSDQPAFAACRRDACANASAAARELLSLPLHPKLTDPDIDRVITAVKQACGPSS
jgi:dTDP-4-amino-4,6-dideoxygalactose transaminase